ncbi:MAG: acyl-CoA synthetase [Verrucomicrobiota bacterium]|jgi:malonyl-CoA/methylmalonyl-CoA synthetase|nr:acyl-CoA synthetase [Verrucomicrobiota bacterium]
MNMPALIKRAVVHGSAPAFVSSEGTRTYRDLMEHSGRLAHMLLGESMDLKEARIGMLISPGFQYAAAQWGVWRAGGVVVPLCLSATESEWEYALSNASVSGVVIATETLPGILPLCQRLGIQVFEMPPEDASQREEWPVIDANRRAMMLYTSGTTSKPKGVVTTHANIQAQIEGLVKAWEWSAEDRIPLFLPLHHIHGIINVMSCALWSGASIEPFTRFDMAAILDRVRADAYSLFMAVPTIYVKLIHYLEGLQEAERSLFTEAFGRMRLMVSGSAALPASVHAQWSQLTGQRLLERYGMTEIGMALSNPYQGERRPGSVGVPLPGVRLRLQGEAGDLIAEENLPGEIQVQGPAVFSEYWDQPELTKDAFQDGWFRTGDMAVLERGYYRIMGRLSVDIIKSGGYKLSALEIEAVLLEHPNIRECAVIGLEDATWGEIVAVAVVVTEPTSFELDSLQEWCRQRLSVYKTPRRLLVLDALPRNAMGKVTKPAVSDLFKR